MTKDDDLAFIDFDEDEEQDDYWDYIDTIIQLRAERRRCERYVIPEDGEDDY